MFDIHVLDFDGMYPTIIAQPVQRAYEQRKKATEHILLVSRMCPHCRVSTLKTNGCLTFHIDT